MHQLFRAADFPGLNVRRKIVHVSPKGQIDFRSCFTHEIVHQIRLRLGKILQKIGDIIFQCRRWSYMSAWVGAALPNDQSSSICNQS